MRARAARTAPRLARTARAGAVARAAAVACTALGATATGAADGPVAGGPSGAQAVPVEASAPVPAVGLRIGDTVVQRVRLGVGARLATPPATGRVDRWFERLAVETVDRTGPAPSTAVAGSPTSGPAPAPGGPELELRHRVVNSPESPLAVALPGTVLALEDGRRLAVPAHPVALVPLVPEAAVARGDFPAMRPDRLTPAPDPGPARARRRIALAGLAATALAWALWWARRHVADAARLPFARARGALARLPRSGRDERPEAWTALHRAIDATAGTAVHPGSIDALVARAPWTRPWRARIERFYAASGARFFADPARPAPFEVGRLVAELARAERRAAR